MNYEQDTYYRFSSFTPNWIATCGVMTYFENHQCHWIGDVIASYVPQLHNADYLKIIEVKVNLEQSSCVFTITDEINGELIRQEIPYTDLTEDLKIWAITEDTRTIVLLPSEY
jgi:hypothetical protein